VGSYRIPTPDQELLLKPPSWGAAAAAAWARWSVQADPERLDESPTVCSPCSTVPCRSKESLTPGWRNSKEFTAGFDPRIRSGSTRSVPFCGRGAASRQKHGPNGVRVDPTILSRHRPAPGRTKHPHPTRQPLTAIEMLKALGCTSHVAAGKAQVQMLAVGPYRLRDDHRGEGRPAMARLPSPEPERIASGTRSLTT